MDRRRVTELQHALARLTCAGSPDCLSRCDCPSQAGFDGSSAVDATDLATLIDVVFFGGPNPCNPSQ